MTGSSGVRVLGVLDGEEAVRQARHVGMHLYMGLG